MSLIKTAAQARAAIGKQVWWDEHSNRYVMLRTGTITEVYGRQLAIDDNWTTLANLRDLRDTAKGGAFPSGAPIQTPI